jgi:hypothetical protein
MRASVAATLCSIASARLSQVALHSCEQSLKLFVAHCAFPFFAAAFSIVGRLLLLSHLSFFAPGESLVQQ